MTKNQIHTRLILSFFFLAVFSCAVYPQAPSEKELYAWVQGIEGRDPEGRREFVLAELKTMGFTPSVQPFTRKARRGPGMVTGKNISVTIGKGKRSMVVGAHYDAVPGSPGANDNGGGVAVVLGLLRATKDLDWKHRVHFCFFDQEEVGLIGSAAFVDEYADSLNHLAMINLDVEGMGTDVFVGPVGGGDDDLLMPLVRRAAATTRFPVQEGKHYPPSDHLSFARRGLENIAVSIVPKGDVKLVQEAVERGWQIDPENIPEVMKFMHTPNDKSEYVSPKALGMSYEFTKTLLTLLNATAKN